MIKGNKQIALIAALSFASILVYINLYVMQGMLPLIAETFDIVPSHASYTLSITTFTLSFSLLLYAVISDRLGRRAPIVISLILLAISNCFLLFIERFDTLLYVRFFQGILLAAIPATAMAYFKDNLTEHFLLKAGAIYIAANSIGGIIGRILGGLMAENLSWTAAMLVLIALTIIGVSCIIALLPYETKTSQLITNTKSINLFDKLKTDINGFIYHLKNKQLRLIYLIGALAFMIMVNQFSFIQLQLIHLFDLSRFQVTLIFICYLSGTLLSLLSAKAICKLGHAQLLMLGFLAMSIGSLLTLINQLVFIFLGFFITAGGFFLLHSCANSFVAKSADKHRAKATALYLCCYYLGASVGGPFMMPFWQSYGWSGVVAASSILLCLMLIVQYRFYKLHREQLLYLSTH